MQITNIMIKERQIKRKINSLKDKQKKLRDLWLDYDLNIIALEYELRECKNIKFMRLKGV